MRVDSTTRKGKKVERIFGNTYIHGTGRRTAGNEVREVEIQDEELILAVMIGGKCRQVRALERILGSF